MRLDSYLHKFKNVKSRTLAARLIKSGAVSILGKKIIDVSHDVEEGLIDDHIEISNADISKYVSRAGLKLESALKYFSTINSNFNPKDSICLDIGSSTGGFTDCLLQHGAKEVFCVDVGSDQLDEKIRKDNRVHVFEKTDIRNFFDALSKTSMNFVAPISHVVTDVSFISLAHIIPALKTLIFKNIVSKDMFGIFLIKPQFEVGPENLNKKGIVSDDEKSAEACKKIIETFEKEKFNVIDCIPSPITGGDGNKEYLIGVHYLEN